MNSVLTFRELDERLSANAGGKGKVLARLYQAGYQVPEGFLILPDAFEGEQLRKDACEQIQANIGRLRKKYRGVSFAVRSSALSEDSEKASFAGEFETILDVGSDEEIGKAIHTVHNSRSSERVQAYSLAKGMDTNHDIAIVVQVFIKPDISGVIFTADPVTGSRAYMVGNFIYGAGEALVSGEVTPYAFKLVRPRGSFEGADELRHFAKRLFKIAVKAEKWFGTPQDMEWAIKDGKIYLLQSRPITTLKGGDPLTGEWNDSLTGDYLWSNANLTEATPDVMTPLTWSLLKILHQDAQPFQVPGGCQMIGNIGGHPYVNLSVMVSLVHVFGADVKKILKKWEDVFGFIPDGLEVPLIPFKLTHVLATIPDNIRWEVRAERLYRKVPEFVSANPEWCESIRRDIRLCTKKEELTVLWNQKIYPHYLENCWILRAVMKKFQEPVFQLDEKLKKLAGPVDTNTLLSNLRGNTMLDSLGPVIALSKLACGELALEEYLKMYGHRGPHELEVSIPGAEEAPDLIEKQLEEFRKTPVDVGALLAGQRKEFDKALKRLQELYPGRYGKIKARLDSISSAACMREALRSEFTRTNRVVRCFALKAGELTDIREDIFFLSIEEILELLSGGREVSARIQARKETHRKYCSLPSYPTLVNGRFDVFQWAANPNRRSYLFDSHSKIIPQSSGTIRGFAGAAGVVEGIVRKLNDMEEGYLLKPGEILVTVTTNIGWTPLFPRAAAIVTDVGAPLSHAAIVARELGVPAVVGCGNATMLLHTGDRVRVDGGNGVVKILETAQKLRENENYCQLTN